MSLLDTFSTASQGLAQGAALAQQRQAMDQYKRALLQQHDDALQQKKDAATAAEETKRQAALERSIGIVSKAVESGSMSPSAGEAYLRGKVPEFGDLPTGFLAPSPYKRTAQQQMDELNKKLDNLRTIANGKNQTTIIVGQNHDTARTTAATTAAGARVTAAEIRGPAGAPKPLTTAQLRTLAEKTWWSGKQKPGDHTNVSASGKVRRGPDGRDDMAGVPIQQAQEAAQQGIDTIYNDLVSRQSKGQPLPGQPGYDPNGDTGTESSPDFNTPLAPKLTTQTRAPLPAHKPAISAAPVDYNDTALLPDMENHARDFTRAFPGARISSRARSHKRNADVGGVPDSQHVHRSAFDAVGVPFQQEPAVRQWAAKRGLEVIPEQHPEDPGRAHFHIQKPRQQAAADDPMDRVAAVYSRYGITPGAADALA